MVNYGEEMLYFICVEQSIIRIPSNNCAGNLVDQELWFGKHRLKKCASFIWYCIVHGIDDRLMRWLMREPRCFPIRGLKHHMPFPGDFHAPNQTDSIVYNFVYGHHFCEPFSFYSLTPNQVGNNRNGKIDQRTFIEFHFPSTEQCSFWLWS